MARMFVLALLVASTLSAAELHVPSQYATIQSAIAASADGDVILVSPGTYTEPVDLMGRRITLRSTDGPAVTILDGATYDNSILIADGGETRETVVQGFTFRNGAGYPQPACDLGGHKGGALFLLDSGITMIDCVFEENGRVEGEREFAIVAGGAIFACQSDLVLDRCRFTRNAAGSGGAIDYLVGLPRTLTIERSAFADNQAGQGSAVVAILYGRSTLRIADTQFDRNVSARGSGVTVAARHWSQTTIERCDFRDNHSTGAGAAIHANFEHETSLRIAECRFERSRASHGAGVLLNTSQSAIASITDSVFSDGYASFGGGAFVNAAGSSVIDIERCDFLRHEAAFGAGLSATARGNLPSSQGGRIRITNSRFLENIAHFLAEIGNFRDECFIDGIPPQGNGLYYGGGADLRTGTGGEILVTNSLFAGNEGNRGGGLHVGMCAGGKVDIVNSTIAHNAPSGLHTRVAPSTLEGRPGVGALRIANSIIQHNESIFEGLDARATPVILYSNIDGGAEGEGNLDTDPLFVDPARYDYSLQPGSACIDAGDNEALPAGVTTDLAGRQRTSRVDIGAYEYVPVKRRSVRK